MKLFYVPGSPYARLIRVALIETGLAPRVVMDESTLRDTASTILPYNPIGRVPTLVLDDGTVLTETLLILGYLDGLHDGAKLLPRDGSDGWRSMAELGRAIGMLDGIAVWNREMRRPEHERSPGVIALETTRANRAADAMQRDIAGGAYAGPVDAARIALGCALGYCERRHTLWRWREGRPGLAAWFDAIAARPSFVATVPPPSGL